MTAAYETDASLSLNLHRRRLRRLLGACDLRLEDEEEIEQALRGARRVIADPLYRRIVPAKSEFYPLPHEAFSGRIYRKQIPNLAERV